MHIKIDSILQSGISRQEKAKQIAAVICSERNYHWVGLYDVNETTINIIDSSGDWPEFPVFPRGMGLNGRAVSTKSVVIVNNTASDPDYLTTFGRTNSELIVPVFSANGEVIGTIDVESYLKNAFVDADVKFLEECAAQLRVLWETVQK